MRGAHARFLGWFIRFFSLIFLITSIIAAYRTHHGSADGGFAAVCACFAAALLTVSSQMLRRRF